MNYYKKENKIHIKKENKGKFTDYCNGKVTDACILKGKNSPDPKIRKRATFAANSRVWKHSGGGELKDNKPTEGNDIPVNYQLSTDVYATPELQSDRLIPIGKGVYRDKVSNKLLYNYDEMPTAEAVGHKKEKSINDNWQTAYAKGIPSGTMGADMETMNAVTGGVMNLLSPSLIVGAAIHSDKPLDYFLNLMRGNNGVVTDKFAQEHPYLSTGANILFDSVTLGAGLHGSNIVSKDVPYTLDKLGFFVLKPNSFTRGIGETTAGLKDLQKSGVVRGNPYGTEVTAKIFGKLYRSNRSNFATIANETGDPSIAQKWFSRSLSKDDFDKLRNAEIKINGEYDPNKKIGILDKVRMDSENFVKQFNTYDDYLKHLEQTKFPTSVDDSGEALAYFYADGRNPLTAGHDYAASNYGVRVNNASSYNPRIFEGHLHYSFPQAVKLSDPNVEVFKTTKFGPLKVTRRMNKNDILKGKYLLGGVLSKRSDYLK